MPGGDKRSYKLKETFREKLQICLNVRDLLLPPGINGVNSQKIILGYPDQSSVVSTIEMPFSIFICNSTFTSV